MEHRKIIENWVNAFNSNDAEQLRPFYHEKAINHQVANQPISGQDAIVEMFRQEFEQAQMQCIIEQILNDGEWSVLEWKDPLGLQGCGFFQIQNNLIVMQRGYWDKLSFLRLHGLPDST